MDVIAGAALLVILTVILTSSIASVHRPSAGQSSIRHQLPLSQLYSPPYYQSVTHILENQLFVSVKTTQRYHYPRLVILLETWAALLKNQVCDKVLKGQVRGFLRPILNQALSQPHG